MLEANLLITANNVQAVVDVIVFSKDEMDELTYTLMQELKADPANTKTIIQDTIEDCFGTDPSEIVWSETSMVLPSYAVTY